MPRNPLIETVKTALVMALVGAGIAALAALVAAQMMKGRTTGIGDIVAVVLSLMFGYPAGACIGLLLARRFLRQQGSLLFGIGGAIIGAVLTMVMAEPLHLNLESGVMIATYVCNVAILGAVGHTLGRRGDQGGGSQTSY